MARRVEWMESLPPERRATNFIVKVKVMEVPQ